MILEKALNRRSAAYARGVIDCLARTSGPRTAMWSEVEKLIQAAHYNGFLSGAVWQKGEVSSVDRHISDWVDALMEAFPGTLTAVPKKGSTDVHWFAWNWFLDITSPKNSPGNLRSIRLEDLRHIP